MRLLLRIALPILLLVVLAACDGNEEPPVEQETVSTADQVVEDEPESSTAGESNADSDEMDEMESGDEDEQHEEDADGEEQEAGHDEDAENHEEDGDGHDEDETPEDDPMTAEALDEDDKADELDGGEEMAAGDGWGESETTAQSACDHPYMPLREGSSWTYDTGEESYTWEVTTLDGDLEQATAVVLVTFDDLTLEYTWDCAAGQGISSFDFAGQGMATALPEMTMELTRGEGEFLPPAEDMVPGHTWAAEFDRKMNFVIGEGDERVEATGDISTVQNSTILSADPITAAGVTVDGVQVEQINEINMVMDMMGTAVEQAQTMNNAFEMGWGIGIMRQAAQSEFGPSSIELISFFIP